MSWCRAAAATVVVYCCGWDVSFAHSGGLDSNGCHAGSQPYHCHRSPDEMVGNRIRCDLGSESLECNSGSAEIPLPEPELPSESMQVAAAVPPIKAAGNTGCAPDDLAYENLCISAQAQATKSTSELVTLIRQFREENRASSFALGDLQVCESQLSEKDSDIFRLSDGAILDKTSPDYVGYQSYGTSLVYTYSSLGLGHLLLEDEDVLEIEVLREPRFCDEATVFTVESASSSKFIINDEIFEAWGICSNLDVGDSVVFSDTSATYGMCMFTTILNVSKGTSCRLSCE